MGSLFSKSSSSSGEGSRFGGLGRSVSTFRNTIRQRPTPTARHEKNKQKEPEGLDYLQVLKPKKGKGRLEFNPHIPKNLTPKGYAKLKVYLAMKEKEYETICSSLRSQKKMWEDPEFQANDSSIGVQKLAGQVEWKRPKDINPQAEFFVGGASRFDIEQGALGDCWLLAAIASITNYPHMFHHILPKEQNIQSVDYVGVFRVLIWRFGVWTQVLVDDRLPVRKGTNQLLFMHSAQNNEFWSALLEKAYAKLNGTYHNLSGGAQSEAMEDFTGGICESIQLAQGKRPAGLFKKMELYCKRCCLMGCCVESQQIEGKLADGLISGHAYSVTGVHELTASGKKVQLVRVRNPWGGKYEWTGDWSDNSPLWNTVDQNERKKMDVVKSDDGEFWISYEDFKTRFTRLEVCHLGLESMEEGQTMNGKTRLDEAIFTGEWQKNINAGGCINNKETFFTNPQFRIEVKDPDPDDEENKTTVIIGLMQKDVRSKVGAQFNVIGFMVYPIDSTQTELLSKAQFMTKRCVAKSTFVNTREVTGNFQLPTGSYVIVPSTFKPNTEAHFIIRVFTQVAIEEAEMDENNAQGDAQTDIQEAIEAEDGILNEREEMIEKFNKMANTHDKAINAEQLKKLLNESTLQDIKGFQGFNLEMCRSMVASVDDNLTGLLEINEFLDLWDRAKEWKMIFLKHDVDKSGNFQAHEFRDALRTAGMHVSNKLLRTLIARHSTPGTEVIVFEDFMLALVRLRTAFATIKAQPKNSQQNAIFSPEDYLRFATYI